MVAGCIRDKQVAWFACVCVCVCVCARARAASAGGGAGEGVTEDVVDRENMCSGLEFSV